MPNSRARPGVELPDLCLAEPDVALIGLISPAEDLYQCALARAIVAYESDDLARYEIQRNIFQRPYSAEILGDTGSRTTGCASLRVRVWIAHVEGCLLRRGQWHVAISHDLGIGIKVSPLRRSRIMRDAVELFDIFFRD